MNGIINVYNNTIALLPGVSKIDMLGVITSSMEIAEDAVKDLAVASGESAATTAETTQVYQDTATEIAQIAEDLTADLKAWGEQQLADALAQHKADFQMREEADAARIQLRKDFLAAEQKYHDDELAANKSAWGITDVEYKVAQASLVTLSADKYAALIEQAEAFGIDDLALLMAHNRNLAQDQLAADNARIAKAKETADKVLDIARKGNAKITQRHKDGSGQSGRAAPGPRNKGQGVMDFAYDDGVLNFSTD